eukprot:1152448-Pelagomonas_calceolata.AAC.6
MKLQSKLGGCMSAKTSLRDFRRPLKDCDRGHGTAAWRPQADSWAWCPTGYDLCKLDAPLFWKELARVTDFKSRWSGCGWR